MSDAASLLTSPSGQRMLTYVAPIYFQSRVAMAIFQANGVEVDDLGQWTAEIRDQLFPQRATWGLKYWEFELGLTTNETLPTATRRQAILSKLVTRVPITPAKIKEIAQQQTGKPAQVENRISPHTFRIVIENNGSNLDLITLNKAIAAAKPAHLTAEYGVLYPAAGVKIDAGMVIAGEGPLYKCGTFNCGTKPEGTTRIEEIIEYLAAIHTAVTTELQTGNWKAAGTFNCGREVT